MTEQLKDEFTQQYYQKGLGFLKSREKYFID